MTYRSYSKNLDRYEPFFHELSTLDIPIWCSVRIAAGMVVAKSRIFLVMCLPGGNREQFPGFHKIGICVHVFFVGGKFKKRERHKQNHLIL